MKKNIKTQADWQQFCEDKISHYKNESSDDLFQNEILSPIEEKAMILLGSLPDQDDLLVEYK